jgi:hypothetical protein
MGTRNGYLLFAAFSMLITTAWAGGKNVNGLTFKPSPQPRVPCLFQLFHVWHQQDPFFKDLKQVKSKHAFQYRRGREVVENFPDSTSITIAFWQGMPGFDFCNTLPAFDPAKVKFHTEWKNDSHTVPAKGSFVASEEAPQLWCEDKCGGRWSYELRIDSQNVPLQDNLIIRIEAEDGTRLAEYTGELDTNDLRQQQHPPVSAAP